MEEAIKMEYEDLKLDYYKRVSSLKSNNRLIMNSLYVTLFCNILVVLILSILSIVAGEDISPIILIGIFTLVIPVIGLYLISSAKDELNYIIDRTLSKCPKINKDDYIELFDICQEVVTKMNLNDIKYQIRYVKNNSFFPGILERSGTIYLLIPRNFISLLFNKPDYARALLFHEFAHVIQGDSNNYLFNGILTEKGYSFGLIMLIITLLAFITTGNFSISIISTGGLISFFGLKYNRLISEELADTNVLIHDDGRNLAYALEQYGIEDTPGNIKHPSPKIRIGFIKNKIIAYNLYTA